ncbi:MAG: radical SAM protein [Oscillospiraceae bacterium]|jgi:cyclic pyranopterin phosphate synthase|nr:radical SAM protein [Oscillospiraceae bacterium]
MEKLKYLRISVTTDCNANCWYCFNEGLPISKNYLDDTTSFEWFMNTVVPHYEIEVVRFTGGEPLLNPHIYDLIKTTRNLSVKKIGFTTNGILLPKSADMLSQCGVNEYAVQICDINEQGTSFEDILSFVTKIQKSVRNVRFNVVVTSVSITNIMKLLEYSCINPINLLVLDLMQVMLGNRMFEKSYVNVSACQSFLVEHGFKMHLENRNSKIYSNDLSNIKIVEHYSDVSTRCTYCTKLLEFNPLLLTPNFGLTVCTHFGRQSFSVHQCVIDRNETLLFKIIENAMKYLSNCDECVNKDVLIEL